MYDGHDGAEDEVACASSEQTGRSGDLSSAEESESRAVHQLEYERERQLSIVPSHPVGTNVPSATGDMHDAGGAGGMCAAGCTPSHSSGTNVPSAMGGMRDARGVGGMCAAGCAPSPPGGMNVPSATGGMRDAGGVGGMCAAGCMVDGDASLDSIADEHVHARSPPASADGDNEQEAEPELDDDEAAFPTLTGLAAALQAFHAANGNAALLLEPSNVVIKALRNVMLVHADARRCAQWLEAATAASEWGKKRRGGASEPAPPATACEFSRLTTPREPAMQPEPRHAARATRSTAAPANDAATSAESHEYYAGYIDHLRQQASSAKAKVAGVKLQRDLLVKAFEQSQPSDAACAPAARHRRAPNFFGGCVSVDEHLDVIMPPGHVLLPHVDADLHELLDTYEHADPELDAAKLVAHVRCSHTPVPRDWPRTHPAGREPQVHWR